MEEPTESFNEETLSVPLSKAQPLLQSKPLTRRLSEQAPEQRSASRLAREQTIRGREWEQALTRGRQAARAAALRAGLPPSDADDLASHFVVAFLRRVPNPAETNQSNSPDNSNQDVAPHHLLPLFLRSEISRFRARTQRESTSPDVETDYPDLLLAPVPEQTEQRGEQRALWEAVASAVWELPHLQRDVLVGFVLNDESLADIAARHDVSVAGARKALYRARRTLHTALRAWRENR